MKPTLVSCRDRALSVFATVIFIAVVAIVVSVIVSIIISALHHLGHGVGQLHQQYTNETEAVVLQLQKQYPGASVTAYAVQVDVVGANANANYFVGFAPFAPVDQEVMIGRSTNLVDWENVADIAAGGLYFDADDLPGAVFYRTTCQSTNHYVPTWLRCTNEITPAIRGGN